MSRLDLLRSLMRYDDWASDRVLEAALPLTDEQLDRPFDMGPGALRRTLLHVVAAEQVWVSRWQGKKETPWPDESEPVTMSTLQARLREVRAGRDAFLGRLTEADLACEVPYRDSFGKPYIAPLEDMIVQLFNHSTHHRAQIVNMLRRVGAHAPELDYMYWKRRPAN